LFVFSIDGLRVTRGALRWTSNGDQRTGTGAASCVVDDAPAEYAMTTLPALNDYFREAESWDADRAAGFRRSAKIAWRVASAGWICAVACSVAIVVLTPLKRVEPFVVRVDNSTGIVDVVPIYAGSAQPEEAITRYFLSHYLTVCERFNFATAESDYEECGAFHSAQRNQAWYAQWTATNPTSPLNVYKDGSSVSVQVKSVSFFTRASGLSDLAQVRYLKALRQGGGSDEKYSHWVATIQYAYSEPAKDPKTRRWNPLGFKVVDFKSEPEVLVEHAEREGTDHERSDKGPGQEARHEQ
jgi:type IV secretion system protein VirB8